MEKSALLTKWFTPPQLAVLFGVNVSTIKRWADKNYLPTQITPGGHRRINQEQLDLFINRYPRHAKNSYVLKRMIKNNQAPSADNWKKYYSCLLKNENKAAGQIIEKLYLTGTPIMEILHQIITPTMRHIGEEWVSDNITVYEEHRMSFNIRLHLMRLEQFIPDKTTSKSPTALLACAPGEFHEMPLQLVDIIFKLQGWRTHLLGINISIKELIEAAKKIKPHVMVISKTYSTQEAPNFFNKLFQFADRQNICLAFGGGAWNKKFLQKTWKVKKCMHFFPTLKIFSEYLGNYKRK